MLLNVAASNARTLTPLLSSFTSPLQDEVGGNSYEAPVWSDPLTHFGHYWDELPELVQEFYNSTIPDLDQSSWDDDDSSIWDDAYSPTPFDFSWSDLTDEQQELGRRIGYTEWSWEGEVSKDILFILSRSDDCVS